MRRALCLADRKDWDAEDFDNLDDYRQEPRRQQLVCLACGGKAMFRSAGVGRKATFSARHTADCCLNSRTWTVFRYLQ
ncbi:hypothetical protein SAMN04487917_10769 [Arthrobacter sp. yr096]|uniref:hypothetical protein n=1 Tax=unclassified Arthrobacter TaxID=235627 RepID=UPI0008950E4C|nr:MULTISPECIES: hypothetical protein [unclassified Arthrobacter]SDX24847.1 hypothetical protein SAMN04487912_10970 [Arthrobacter sp. cf158]SEJ56132.1 hypothetical protein SAMN04487917_10769 [Arthrobacter sp. yr096]